VSSGAGVLKTRPGDRRFWGREGAVVDWVSVQQP